jgi:modification methylase
MNNIQLPKNRIILGDCVEVLETFPENSIDMIFADPPYNLQLNRDLWRPNQTKVDAVDDDWDKFSSLDEYDNFSEAWLTASRRVLKDTGTIWVIGTYHNIFRVGSILQDLGFWILNDIVWIKTNPMPNFRGVRFTNAQETLIWAQKRRGKKYTFNYHSMKALNGDLQMRSDWYFPLCSGNERIKINGKKAHTAQKPEALLYRVIQSGSNPGDIVLDPFFGTGTTGVVAKKLHRQWIGIEMDRRYIQLAQERIDEVPSDQFSDEIYTKDSNREKKRIPFGSLIENGLLQPGQKLYFRKKSDDIATIMANGHIRYNGKTGSIHQVAREITKTPSNGWQEWYFYDEDDEIFIVIDVLRENLREKMLSDTHNEPN